MHVHTTHDPATSQRGWRQEELELHSFELGSVMTPVVCPEAYRDNRRARMA